MSEFTQPTDNQRLIKAYGFVMDRFGDSLVEGVEDHALWSIASESGACAYYQIWACFGAFNMKVAELTPTGLTWC